MTNYDSIPYPSYCYQASDPNLMSAIGTLFGMKSTAVTKAKVLELGCASGGDILPLASRYPDSKFVSIDKSANQIAVAKKLAQDLHLENIEFKAASITDYVFVRDLYDYIIVHGLYSWVPVDVRVSILEICKDRLTPNGLALISYNTLPGWNVVKTLRDMMLYHAQNFLNQRNRCTKPVKC